MYIYVLWSKHVVLLKFNLPTCALLLLGASQPSRTAGTIFYIYVCIQRCLLALHMNCVVHMGPARPGFYPHATHKRKASSLKVRRLQSYDYTKKLKLQVLLLMDAERSLSAAETRNCGIAMLPKVNFLTCLLKLFIRLTLR